MDRERGDEIPFGEPMKQPENMDAGEMTADRYTPTEEEVRQWVTDWLDEHDRDIDAAEFFECIDPEGGFRYTGSFDPWDAIHYFVDNDPRVVADVIREQYSDLTPMDPRKGPNQ